MNEPKRELIARIVGLGDFGWQLSLTLGLFALGAPYLAMLFTGLDWAALVAATATVMWFRPIQAGSKSGGLFSRLMPLLVLVNTLGIVGIALLRLVVPASS